MRLTNRFLILATILLFPVLCFAQGSGSSESSKSRGGGKTSGKKSNFAITRSISGVVNSIGSNSISLKTPNGKTVSFVIGKTRVFAGGRPRIGQNVRVTYTANDRKVTNIR